MKPIWAKSIWHSTPGSPSNTRIDVPRARKPHSSDANRCNVRYGTIVPDRVSSTSIFTTDNPSFTQVRDLLLPGGHQIPRRTVTVRPGRADRGDHRPDQLVTQRRLSRIAGQPGGLRRLLSLIHI